MLGCGSMRSLSIFGYAGNGKSTYCKMMGEYISNTGNSVYTLNLDPAAVSLPYEPDIDVRHLINVNDVMHEFLLGPNGSTLFCLNYLETNLRTWFSTEVTALPHE